MGTTAEKRNYKNEKNMPLLKTETIGANISPR